MTTLTDAVHVATPARSQSNREERATTWNGRHSNGRFRPCSRASCTRNGSPIRRSRSAFQQLKAIGAPGCGMLRPTSSANSSIPSRSCSSSVGGDSEGFTQVRVKSRMGGEPFESARPCITCGARRADLPTSPPPASSHVVRGSIPPVRYHSAWSPNLANGFPCLSRRLWAGPSRIAMIDIFHQPKEMETPTSLRSAGGGCLRQSPATTQRSNSGRPRPSRRA
jgi:hypothetical protein